MDCKISIEFDTLSFDGGLRINVDKLRITGARYTKFDYDVDGIRAYISMCFSGENCNQNAFFKFWACIRHKFKTDNFSTQFLYRNTKKQQKYRINILQLSLIKMCNTELGSVNSLRHPIFTFWKISLTRNLLKCQTWLHVWGPRLCRRQAHPLTVRVITLSRRMTNCCNIR